MGARLAFRLGVAAAVVMLAVMPLMAIPSPPCNPLPMPTILAFELVRSVADLQQIFGQPGEACRAALVAEVDRANLIDSLAYIPAYTAFFALTAYALGRRDPVIGWMAVTLALGCAVADWFENASLFALSAAPDSDSPWLLGLIVSTNSKWIGLAVVTTLCGAMLARRGGLGWGGLVACAAPLPIALWTLAAPDTAGQYVIVGMTLASLALLAVALVESFRRTRGNRDDAPA